MRYFLIHNVDGDTYVTEYDKDELLKELDGNEYSADDFLDALPENGDTNCWQGKYLLVKGEVVTPQKKEIVAKYDLP